MNDQSDSLLIQRAIRQFSPDIFQHPVWIRFAASSAARPDGGAEPLLRSARQMLAEGDVPGACSVLFLCAAHQAGRGDCTGALESIAQVLKLAKRHHLSQVAIWGHWAASAVCIQMGAYAQSAGYLLRLQQELYHENDWVLANLVELVRQSLLDGAKAIGPAVGQASEQPGLLIAQMLCWGKSAATPAAGAFPRAPGRMAAAAPPRVTGLRKLWQNLHNLILGEPVPSPAEAGPPSPSCPAFPPASSPSGIEEECLSSAAAPPNLVPITAPPAALLLTAPPPEQAVPSETEPSAEPGQAAPGEAAPPPQMPPSAPADALPLQGPSPAEPPAAPGATSANPPEVETPPPAPSRPALPPLPEIAPAPLLNAYLLGSFRVELGGAPVETWPNGRCRSVFAYLLDHHAHAVPREELIEAFWPEIRLDSARNSLNVAIYTLRHALRSICDIPVILLHESAYQINPDLPVWVDVEAFEQHARDGSQLESAGALVDAACEYRLAIGLYPGDFMADTPYEDWTTLKRERLRMLYLETLDHLSRFYFNQGAYAACVGLCQRILSQDACREDAHCRLMRCYARQGQVHQALRQYQACVEALRAELDVEPSPSTVQLCRQIKRQEAV